MNPKVIIFDLDDTLVDTSHVFWLARSRFLKIMERRGFNAKRVEKRFEEIDGDHISKFGYLPARYEHSMVAAYREFTDGVPIPQRARTLQQIRSAGKMVATRMPALISGARGVLSWAKRRGYRSLLLTRGVKQLQTRKINANRIEGYFEKVRVVPTKTQREFRDAIASMSVRPEETWVVGDSIRSDINPGLELGCRCILYRYTHHSYVWKQEHGIQPIGPHYAVKTLAAIPKVISSPWRYREISLTKSSNKI